MICRSIMCVLAFIEVYYLSKSEKKIYLPFVTALVVTCSVGALPPVGSTVVRFSVTETGVDSSMID